MAMNQVSGDLLISDDDMSIDEKPASAKRKATSPGKGREKIVLVIPPERKIRKEEARIMVKFKKVEGKLYYANDT